MKGQLFNVLLYLYCDSFCNTANNWHLYQGVSYRGKDIGVIVGLCRRDET